MDWKKTDILMLEGEMANPGEFTSMDKQKTRLTPEFYRRVFDKFDKNSPLYISHGDRNPIGSVTSVGYDTETNVLHYRGIATDYDRARFAEEQGFDYVSPEFEVTEWEQDGNIQVALDGYLTGLALTRKPAIYKNAESSRNWIAFSEVENELDTEQPKMPQNDAPTTAPVIEQAKEAPEVKEVIIEKHSGFDLPKDIKSPKWVKMDNGGYYIMDESMTPTKTEVKKTEVQNVEKHEMTPEQIAQIELAKRTLEEKQKYDAEQLNEYKTKFEQITSEIEKLKEVNDKYKSKYDTVMSTEIKNAERELRGLGFSKPEEYLKDADLDIRLAALEQAKSQLVKKTDANVPVDMKISEESNNENKSKADMAKELGLSDDLIKYLK